jgi:hypothetical protein
MIQRRVSLAVALVCSAAAVVLILKYLPLPPAAENPASPEREPVSAASAPTRTATHAQATTTKPAVARSGAKEGWSGKIPGGFFERQAFRQEAAAISPAPPGAREAALAHRDAMRAAQPANATLPWQSIGPSPIREISSGGNARFADTGRVRAVAVDPNDPNVIYVGAATGGVWKSINGGATWTPIGDRTCSLASSSIAIDPVDPRIVYVGTGELHGQGCGLLRTTDGGQTWQTLGAEVFQKLANTRFFQPIWRIAIDPRTAGSLSGTTIHVASEHGLFKSTDGGATWVKKIAPDRRGHSFKAWDVILDPRNPDVAYAAAIFADPLNSFGLHQGGIFKSVDAGETWIRLSTGLPPANETFRTVLALAPSNPDIVYAAIGKGETIRGIFRSQDAGQTWQQVTTMDAGNIAGNCGVQCLWNLALTVDPRNPQTVYFGGIPLYRSDNGGQTWSIIQTTSNLPINKSIHVDIHQIVFDRFGRLLAVSDGGLFRAVAPPDWEPLNGGLAATQFFPGIALHPTDASVVIGNTQDTSLLMRSGSTWRHIPGAEGGSALIDPANPARIYSTTFACAQLGCGTTGIPYRSEDGGATFSTITQGLTLGEQGRSVPPFVMDPSNPQTLLFGSNRVYRSTNRGDLWTPISPALTDSTSGELSALAVAPSSSSTIYAASGYAQAWREYDHAQVWVTSDTGGNWTNVTGSLPQRRVSDIAVDPADASTAYLTFAGYGSGHVFRTTDRGGSWQDISGTLPDAPVYAVIIAGIASPRTLYLATEVGVFKSNDGGSTWLAFSDGLPNSPVLDIAFNATTNVLVASTYGRGMFAIGMPCGYTATPASSTVAAAAGAGTITVATGAGCGWDAIAHARWITLGAPTAASGNGTVGFTLSANPLPIARSGGVTVAGQTLVITQEASASPVTTCPASLAPGNVAFAVAGGSADVAVTAPGTCSWTATSFVPWITVVSGASATGGATVRLEASANISTAPRSGSVVVGGAMILVSQPAATFTVLGVSPSHAITTGGTFVTITGAGFAPGATVTFGDTPATNVAVPNNATITATLPPHAPGQVDVVVTNPGGASARRVKGFSYESCTVAALGVPQVFGALGGSVGVRVEAQPGCTWTATNDAAWIDIARGTGSGTGGFVIGIAANGGTPRTANLSIGGQTFAIAQSASSCATFGNTQRFFDLGFALMPIQAPAGCSWTAQSNAPWATVTQGAAGVGNGTVQVQSALGEILQQTSIVMAGVTFPIGTKGPVVNTPTVPTYDGCAYRVTTTPGWNPNPLFKNVSVPPEGVVGTGAINPDIAFIEGDCPWTATTTADWLTVTKNGASAGPGTVTFVVAPNPTAQPREAVLSIAGNSFTIAQQAGPRNCTFALSETQQIVAQNGGTFSVDLTAAGTCIWRAATGSGWLNVSPSEGTGNATLTVTVARAPDLVGTRTTSVAVGNASMSVTQGAGFTTVSIDKKTLRFGATHSGFSFVGSTSAQNVRLTQNGSGTVGWTATPSHPWITVSPSSGSSLPATLSIGVSFHNSVPAAGVSTGSVMLSLTGASGPAGPIAVNLTTAVNGTSSPPTGVFDTPIDNATGLTGSIAVSGWAVDDVEVTRVVIYRDPVAGETSAQVFIGDAVLIDGARPDVAAANPATPRNTQAGWGYLMLTNFLPNQGTGTYRITAVAYDAEGNSTVLGSRTITCTNNIATKPFGAIDTPGQGEVVGGASFLNFGWVLARGPARADPPSGGSVTAFVDGVPVGAPGAWGSRPDLTTLFPAGTYPGVTSALGVIGLDTTTLANGVHTIFWIVTASTGESDGIGSRFFTVANSQSASVTTDAALTAAAGVEGRSVRLHPALLAADHSGHASLRDEVNAAPLARSRIRGRRGFDLSVPVQSYPIDDRGRATMLGEELDRLEIQLDGSGYTGYMRIGDDLGALPIGSHLDPTTGVFTWAPGAGFVNGYDLVFVRRAQGIAQDRHEVQVVLAPKQSNRVGPQVVIDIPSAHAAVAVPFVLAGWGVDVDASVGTGVDTLHVWAYPVRECGAGDPGACDPIWVGATAYGGARPDVGAIFGDRFTNSGYSVTVDSLPPGTYDLAVFAWSTVRNRFVPAQTVRVRVADR